MIIVSKVFFCYVIHACLLLGPGNRCAEAGACRYKADRGEGATVVMLQLFDAVFEGGRRSERTKRSHGAAAAGGGGGGGGGDGGGGHDGHIATMPGHALMPVQLQKQEDPYPQALERIAAQVHRPPSPPSFPRRTPPPH